MILQSSLGKVERYAVPRFDHFKIAIITSTYEFDSKRRIEVRFNNGGAPVPVQVVESLGTQVPEQGDWVVVGYIEGSKHRPFLVGYVKDLYRTSDILRLGKDFIEVKFPTVFDEETHDKEFKHFVIRIEMPDPNSDSPKNPQIVIQMPDTVDKDPTRVMLDNTSIQIESADLIKVLAKGDFQGIIEQNADINVKGNLTGVINKDAEITVSGNLQGQVGGELKAIAGGTATIQAGGAVNIQGSVINLN